MLPFTEFRLLALLFQGQETNNRQLKVEDTVLRKLHVGYKQWDAFDTIFSYWGVYICFFFVRKLQIVCRSFHLHCVQF